MMPGTLPPAPKPGDTIAVVAPAGPMLSDRMEAALAPLRDAGLHVEPLGPMSGSRTSRAYLAGTDAQRLDALIRALLEPRFAAVVCVRGGYGSMRLLPGLRARLRNTHVPPKRLCGFSDITALHAWALSELGWASLHAPMPFNFAPSSGAMSTAEQRAAQDFVQSLLTHEARWTSTPLERVTPGSAEGVLVGGNLTLVSSLYRSPWLESLKGRLLFLEDVGEKTYRLDRMVTSLALRGAADEVAGVVLGSFTKSGELGEGAASHFVGELFADWGVPVVRGLSVGHVELNRSLWLGLRYRLEASGALRLR